MLRWKEKRLEHGQREYGAKHLHRNGPIDIAEELLDALNIMGLQENDRWSKIENTEARLKVEKKCEKLFALINLALDELKELDELLDEKDVTDQEGGERIWFNY